MKQATNDNQRQNGRISYNGEPIKEGEVLVPMLIDPAYASSIGAQGLRTWCKGGIRFTVMFVPVPAEQELLAWKTFNANVNELLNEKLGPNRYSRCPVPQEDGTYKTCPKPCNGNHEPCARCPHRGEYQKEDRSIVSLSQLDEENYYPTENEPSAEDQAMLEFLLNDLLKCLGKMNPLYEQIVRLGYLGYRTKEIVEQLPLKKSQAYRMIAECRKRAEEFLKE